MKTMFSELHLKFLFIINVVFGVLSFKRKKKGKKKRESVSQHLQKRKSDTELEKNGDPIKAVAIIGIKGYTAWTIAIRR